MFLPEPARPCAIISTYGLFFRHKLPSRARAPARFIAHAALRDVIFAVRPKGTPLWSKRCPPRAHPAPKTRRRPSSRRKSCHTSSDSSTVGGTRNPNHTTATLFPGPSRATTTEHGRSTTAQPKRALFISPLSSGVGSEARKPAELRGRRTTHCLPRQAVGCCVGDLLSHRRLGV